MKILKILLYIALVVMLQSCGLTKKVFKTTTQTQTEKTDVKKDSTTIVEVSKPIKDQIVVNVPKSDNEAVNKALDAILKQLNTSKSSGSNS
ncbi:MAG: hypothetical protein GY743_23785, partial [Planctomycetaceae bacterium]|nr:hypothetical protein [Planctomycetaceae bacterium]